MEEDSGVVAVEDTKVVQIVENMGYTEAVVLPDEAAAVVAVEGFAH